MSSCWVAAVPRRGRTAASLTVYGRPPTTTHLAVTFGGETLRVVRHTCSAENGTHVQGAIRK